VEPKAATTYASVELVAAAQAQYSNAAVPSGGYQTVSTKLPVLYANSFIEQQQSVSPNSGSVYANAESVRK
jgi:hypothetical protein